jgi:hypothetical protein
MTSVINLKQSRISAGNPKTIMVKEEAPCWFPRMVKEEAPCWFSLACTFYGSVLRLITSVINLKKSRISAGNPKTIMVNEGGFR